MVIYEEELVDSEDIFENDEIVLTKYYFKSKYFNIEKLEAGIKNDEGEIVKFIELRSQII